MVGNSVNCHAEMSADIASMPSWKVALLERKRLHDKDSSSSTDSHTASGPLSDHHAVGDGTVPGWKRDILARKQNQKNSFVFLAKSGPTGDSHTGSSLPAVNNGHVHSVVYESLGYSTEPADAAVVDMDISDTAENQPVEERLLPIHQNPILRLDLKKRHQSSSSSTRSSLSPRVACTSTGNQEHSSTVSSVSSHAPVTPDSATEEVFSNENDVETEVAYGKGFVHKLLMKFSHLTGSGGEPAPNNRLSKQKFSSLSDGPSLLGSGAQRKISQDLESVPFKSSSGMPTAKFHSADDLLHETKFNIRIDHADSADELDMTVTSDYMNGDLSAHLDHSDGEKHEDDVSSQRNSSSSENPDELPFANIVSTARSLFESLAVHSAPQKRSPSPVFQNTPFSRFSYIGTLERSKQLRGKSVTKTSVPEASAPKMTDQLYADPSSSMKSTVEILQPDSSALANDGEPLKSANARLEGDSSCSKSVHESVDGRTNGPVVSPASPGTVYTYASVFNRGVSSSISSTPQPVLTPTDVVGSSNSDVHLPKSSAHDQEHEILPTVSTTLSRNTAGELCPSTDTSTTAAKPIHTDNSLLSTQPSDNKENVKIQPASSSKKPQPALRPGKLVIRPASNLVAAKTSSEYLELTKFNDVRKGEFAPPLKKERIDRHVMDDDDADRVDGVAGDSVITEEYIFIGAGVIIGRSLLTKTNKNKSVNAHYFII